MFSDEISERSGLLQRLDPRIKVVSLLVLLVTTALARNVGILAGLYAVGLLLAVTSGLSLRFFVVRVWLFVPIFTMVIVVPATLSFVTPGHIVVPLGSWWGSPVGLTEQGLTSAALIVSRVATSISFVVLLALTTPWSRLLSALQALHVPRVFVLVTGMAYRYIFYLLGSVTEMYTARKARTVSQDAGVRAGRAFVGASAGTLFARTYTLSEEVHMAMISRGYAAGRPTTDRARARTTDWAFLGVTVLVAVIAIGLDRV